MVRGEVAGGPGERAVALVCGRAPHEVEALGRSKLGDFRVDLSGLPDAEAARFCAALSSQPGIESAVHVPPRAYVRVTLPFLSRAVLGAVAEEGEAFAWLPPGARDAVLFTYSDPNANKPLHVGHLRNVFLGSALAGIHAARGHTTRREGTFGDWGVHMCQALLTYLGDGAEATPEAAGQKGDRFVGELYTRYHRGGAGGEGGGAGGEGGEDGGAGGEGEARALLVRMERGDPLRATQLRLSEWAIAGIRQTYQRVGVAFDALFKETDHLDAARALMDEGVRRGVLARRADGCVVYRDPAEEDDTVLVRPDGTLLVYAQMMGIDTVRFAGRGERIVSIFGHQWEAAALTYREIGRGLGEPWASRYEPVFYGMVQLPDGSMRSRQGRAVTADDAVDDLRDLVDGDEELAVAVLRYHLLRRSRLKTLVFDPRAIAERTLPLLRRALAYGWDEAETAGGGAAPEFEGLGAKRAEAVRRLLLAVNGVGSALDEAIERLDPAAALHHLEELVGLADQLPAGAWTGSLRGAVGAAVRAVLVALEIVPTHWSADRGGVLCTATT